MFRSYGPGKFDSLFDSWIYAVSLDGGPDEEVGNVYEIGEWYGFMSLDSQDAKQAVVDAAKEAGDAPLTEEEQEELNNTVAVIIFENSQGFVQVEDYFDMGEAHKDWNRISKKINEIMEATEEDSD